MHLQGSLFGNKLHALCYRPGVALGLISLKEILVVACAAMQYSRVAALLVVLLHAFGEYSGGPISLQEDCAGQSRR